MIKGALIYGILYVSSISYEATIPANLSSSSSLLFPLSSKRLEAGPVCLISFISGLLADL